MQKRIFWLGMLLFGLLLTGCVRPWGGEVVDAVPEPLPSFTPVPASAIPSQTPTSTATSTTTPTATPTNTPAPTATPSRIVQGPAGFPANVNPLTGLTVDDPTLMDRNPVAIKISNFPRGLRPHSGLSSADMVFEYYIGVGATRFTAIFYGQDIDKAGPIRSARLIDIPLVRAYQGIMGFVSADAYVYERVTNALGGRAISQSGQTCPAICRTGSGDVNSVFSNTAEMTIWADEYRGITPEKPNLDGMLFDSEPPTSGETGTQLGVNYSFTTRSEWRYNDETGLYERWIEQLDQNNRMSMIPLIDRNNDEQVTAANVIVMFSEHIELQPTLHDIPLKDNQSGERGILFRDGQTYEIRWRSINPDRPFQFYSPDGNLMTLKPGNTFVQIVGLRSTVDSPADGQTEIVLFLP